MSLTVDPIERATGLMMGFDPDSAKLLPAPPPNMTPIEAFESSVRDALRHSPCVVLFSGGRDSSAILAVAARVAQKEGLPLPIPVTHHYRGAGPEVNEREWQELVVSYLGLRNWEILTFDHELDCLGPISRDVMARHGALFPNSCHALLPALELARGGSLLTGSGGDEALIWRSRLTDVLARRVRPTPRDVTRLAFALGAPGWARRRRARRTAPAFIDWLTAEGTAMFHDRWARVQAKLSFRWDKRLRQGWTSRGFQLALRNMDLLANEHDVRLAHPFGDPRFVSVLARAVGGGGYESRTHAMRSLFDGTLPDRVNSRSTKAVFSEAYWNRHSRTFAESWSGEGVDTSLVDVEALKAHWRADALPPAPTLMLAKQAWVAMHRSASSKRAE